MKRCALYRHYGEGDVLLYVGISLNHIRRLMQHRQNAAWFEDIRRVTIEWFPSREAALVAELAAIQAERPLHNVAGTKSEPVDSLHEALPIGPPLDLAATAVYMARKGLSFMVCEQEIGPSILAWLDRLCAKFGMRAVAIHIRKHGHIMNLPVVANQARGG